MTVSKLFPSNPSPEGGATEGVPGELGVMFKVTATVTMTAFHLYIPSGAKPTFLLLWERTAATKGTLLRKQAYAGTGTGNWVEVAMSKTITLETGKTYIAAFYSATGVYGYKHSVFATAPVAEGNLYAFKDGEGDTGIGAAVNGCFVFDSERGGAGAGGGKAEGGTEGLCPKAGFSSTSYQMDVVVETAGGGKALKQEVGDTVTFTDSVKRAAKLKRTDTFTATDAVRRAVKLKRGDAFTVTDAVRKAVMHPVADVLKAADSVRRSAAIRRGETVTFTDSVRRAAAHRVADTLVLVDAVRRAVKLKRGDTFTATDTVKRKGTKRVADTVTFSDSVRRAIRKRLADVAAFVDGVTTKLEKATGTDFEPDLLTTLELAGGPKRTMTLANGPATELDLAAVAADLALGRVGSSLALGRVDADLDLGVADTSLDLADLDATLELEF